LTGVAPTTAWAGRGRDAGHEENRTHKRQQQERLAPGARQAQIRQIAEHRDRDHRDGEPSKHRLGHAQQVGQQEGQDAAKMLTLRSAGPDQADGSGRPDGVLPAWFRR
jgi:hypothetical protein